MRQSTIRAAALAAVVVLATGCAGMSGPAVAADAAAPGLPAALREAVRADAARRAGVAAGAVRLARAEAVTWSDGALGCPQPGLAYTQALIPGWLLVAEAGGRQLRYHADGAGTRWLHCEAARAQAPLPGDIAR